MLNIFFAVLMVSTSSTPPESINCPASISAHSKLSIDIEGWEVSGASDANSLYGARIFLGPAQKRRAIAPLAMKENGRERASYFARPPTEDVWMECSYTNTSIKMLRNIGKVVDCVSEREFRPVPYFSIECEKAE